jgi:hypothetical protein
LYGQSKNGDRPNAFEQPTAAKTAKAARRSSNEIGNQLTDFAAAFMQGLARVRCHRTTECQLTTIMVLPRKLWLLAPTKYSLDRAMKTVSALPERPEFTQLVALSRIVPAGLPI